MSKTQNDIEVFLTNLRRRRMVKRVLKVFRGLLYFFVVFFILSWILLQNEGVQNFLVNKVTNYLSKELKTTVAINRIDFDFFDKLILEKFVIKDQSGDTLLYSGSLKANFNTNLITLIRGKLKIDNLYLEDAQINLFRDSAQQFTNAQFILNYLKGDTSQIDPNKKPFLVDIDGIYLKNIKFFKDDIAKGELISVDLAEGEIQFENLNLPENRIHIKSLKLDQPNIRIDDKNEYLPASLEEAIITIQNGDNPEAVAEIDSTSYPFIGLIDQIQLVNATFELHNLRKEPVKLTPDDILNYRHLNVFDINLNVDSLQFKDDVFGFQLKKLSFRDESGFVLNNLSSEDASVSNQVIELNGLQLQTPFSDLGNSIILKYKSFEDFKDFENKVRITAKFNHSQVAVKDIMVFAPGLENNKFFVNNRDEIIQINGDVSGTINKLRGKNLEIKLGKGVSFKGDFSSRDLAVRNEELLNLQIDRFATNMTTLRMLVPGFDPPKNYNKLGLFSFTGRFDGFFNDFVTNGELNTAVGKAVMDMNLNYRKGAAQADYSGKLSLLDFDLKKWTGNDDFGKITFVSEVKDGIGLTLETVEAKLGARIANFTYKGYSYENIVLDGELKKNLFDGNLTIKDDNIDFVFRGFIDFVDSIPKFDFKANVNKMDLKAINLSKQNIVLAGDIDLNLEGRNLSTIEGVGTVSNFKAIRDEAENFEFDTLVLKSNLYYQNQRELTIDSDILKLHLDGIFDIQEVPAVITHYIDRNFPGYSERFNIHNREKAVKESNFDFSLEISNSKNFTYLLDPGLDTLYYVTATGHVDNTNDSLQFKLNVPSLKFKNISFNDISFKVNGEKDVSNFSLDVFHTSINEKQHFEPIVFRGSLEKDTINFRLNSSNFASIFDDLNLRGKFFLVEDYFQVQFLPSNLFIFKDQWDIAENNFIRFGKGFVETQNFDMQNFEKRIVIESIHGTGLTMSLENFDLSLIDEAWNYDRLDFGGKFYVLLEAGNIYKLENIYATAMADTLFVNGDNFGELRLDVSIPSLNDNIETYLSITNGSRLLKASGHVAPIKRAEDIVYTNDFVQDVTLKEYPLSILEYFILNGITETTGSVNADVRFDGAFKKPNINGNAYVSGMEVTIDYLQTRYSAPFSVVKINNSIIDATGNKLYDALGNEALVYGGITHDHLKNFALDVSVDSDEFLFLDTKKKDNNIYYGFAKGRGDVQFKGPFQQTDITINATTGIGTKLEIPLVSAQSASEVSFISFINKEAKIEVEESNQVDLRGVNVDMNLTITPDAHVLLLIDEKAGDIIRGNGSGDLQIKVTRSGDFNIYGTYEIEKGDYLFTLLNLINKPFKVKKGGSITWNGDPFGADIDIEAQYARLRKPVYNFIIEYLQDDNIKGEARSPTEIDLTMALKGKLMQPEIEFDIEFPSLTGELKNYAESKLRTIRQDQNELNRQVFGLLVVGGFLPDDSGGSQGGQGMIATNTLSELLSNQLSMYLTELLSEVFTDVDFISGVDFVVNWSVYEADQVLTPSGGRLTVTGNQFELRQRFDLFNDRFSVNLGGSYVDQSSSYFTGDIVLEYYLTKNRRFKVNFYQLSDETLEGRRNKTGLGFSVQREFDSLNDFISSLRSKKKKQKKQTND